MIFAILSAVAFAVLLLIGYFVVSLAWPLELSRRLKWVFAPATGAGICAIGFIVFRRPLFTVELAALVVLAGVNFLRHKQSPAFGSTRPAWRVPGSVLLLTCALGAAVAGLIVQVDHQPHGDHDATAIWTSHARYLYRDGPNWQRDILHTFHADYPLLVPAMTARIWRYSVEERPDSGGIVGMFFTLAGVAVLVGILIELRDTTLAVLTGLLLLGTPFYLEYGVSQSADVPLSLYVLSAIGLLCLQSMRAPDSLGLAALSGFLAGCAGWTKNEGLLFIAVMSAFLLLRAVVRRKQGLRNLLAFAAGALAPLVLIGWFKLSVAPQNDIFGNRHSSEVVQKLLDPARHSVIRAAFWTTFCNFGEWLIHPAIVLLALIAVRGVDPKMLRSSGWIGGACALGAVLLGYYTIYVITPMNLDWHLMSSLPRLFLQLWPASLLLASLAARTQPGSVA